MASNVTHTQAVSALRALYERHAKTQRWIVEYSLIALAHEARAMMPTVTTIRLEWSNQGDFLDIREYRDADGQDLDPDHTVDLDSSAYCWNLGGDNQSKWMELVTEVKLEGHGCPYYDVDVDKALAISPAPGS